MLLGLLSRRLQHVAWTGATRCCMVCRSTCCGKSSRCKMPPLVTHQHMALRPCHSSVASTSFRDEWNLRLHVSYSSLLLQRRQRTCLLIFDSSPSIVVLISVHLLTEHWLFHGCAPASVTEVSLLRTVSVEHFAVYILTDDQLQTV